MIFVIDDLRDFGDYVAPALDLHPVSDLHTEALDLVHVVQSCVANGRAANLNWRKHRDRCEFPGAADLYANVFQFRDPCARGVLVGDRPRGALPVKPSSSCRLMRST